MFLCAPHHAVASKPHQLSPSLTRVGFAHLSLALLKARQHVMRQYHRLELDLRLGHVAVLSREHVDLPCAANHASSAATGQTVGHHKSTPNQAKPSQAVSEEGRARVGEGWGIRRRETAQYSTLVVPSRLQLYIVRENGDAGTSSKYRNADDLQVYRTRYRTFYSRLYQGRKKQKKPPSCLDSTAFVYSSRASPTPAGLLFIMPP